MKTKEDIDWSNKIKKTAMIKEGRLKRYWDKSKQYRQNRTFQNNEKNSTNN